MGKVVFNMTMSLDGFVAGPNDNPDNGLGDGGDALFKMDAAKLERIRVVDAPGVTHLGFRVVK